MLNQISYFQIFGLPAIAWGGMLTALCLIFAAIIPVLNKKGIHSIPIEWHYRMAGITVCLGLIHGILALLAYF